MLYLGKNPRIPHRSRDGKDNHMIRNGISHHYRVMGSNQFAKIKNRWLGGQTFKEVSQARSSRAARPGQGPLTLEINK